MLHELSKKKAIQDREISGLLKNKIRDLRRRMRDNVGQDVLEEKWKLYGPEGRQSGRWLEQKLLELSRMIYDNKTPPETELGKWISVEIECMFKNRQSEKDFALFIKKQGLSKLITIKTDNSIHPDTEHDEDCDFANDDENECTCGAGNTYGKEIVVTFRNGDWNIIKEVCGKLNSLKATVNKTCGLHVHFDCRHLTQRKVTNQGKKVAQVIAALKQILPPSRSNNEYCARDINTHSGGRNSRSARYAFVNLQAYERHKTLEIRGHSGTTDATKIINWVRILSTVMSAKKSKTKIELVSEFINAFKFEQDLVDYITMRFNKFSAQKAQKERSSDDVRQDNETILPSISEMNVGSVIETVFNTEQVA